MKICSSDPALACSLKMVEEKLQYVPVRHLVFTLSFVQYSCKCQQSCQLKYCEKKKPTMYDFAYSLTFVSLKVQFVRRFW